MLSNIVETTKILGDPRVKPSSQVGRAQPYRAHTEREVILQGTVGTKSRAHPTFFLLPVYSIKQLQRICFKLAEGIRAATWRNSMPTISFLLL